jgi:hypothetical protein
VLAGEARGQRLDEVGVHGATVRTGEHAAVVRVEVQPLVRVDQRLMAAVALETLGAARHGGENVVAVHGAKDEAGTVPWLGARPTAYRGTAATF